VACRAGWVPLRAGGAALRRWVLNPKFHPLQCAIVVMVTTIGKRKGSPARGSLLVGIGVCGVRSRRYGLTGGSARTQNSLSL